MINLSLWEDANTGIAEVDNARRRLVGLKEQQAMRVFILVPFYVFS
jgi:hypothetical protein